MKKIMILVIAVMFAAVMYVPFAYCISEDFAPPGPQNTSNPDNTLTGNPNLGGGGNSGGGNTGGSGGEGGMTGPTGSNPGSSPGTKLFGTFPKTGD